MKTISVDPLTVFITRGEAAAFLFLFCKLSWTVYRQTDCVYVSFFYNSFSNVHGIIFTF